MDNDLILNIHKLHTTPLGIERIRRNLCLSPEQDVVNYCKSLICSSNEIIRKGKNWYISASNSVITVNAYSYTIITAHQLTK